MKNNDTLLIKISKELKEKLRLASWKEKKSMAEYIRELIESKVK